MKNFFKITIIAVASLFTSCSADAQQKDNYASKIDSLVKATHPRSFNGVVFIQQNEM